MIVPLTRPAFAGTETSTDQYGSSVDGRWKKYDPLPKFRIMVATGRGGAASGTSTDSVWLVRIRKNPSSLRWSWRRRFRA